MDCGDATIGQGAVELGDVQVHGFPFGLKIGNVETGLEVVDNLLLLLNGRN